MIAVLSPAKKLDETLPQRDIRFSQPQHSEDFAVLAACAKKLSVEDIASLMKVSDKLATLNHGRFQQWSLPFSEDNAFPAVFLFAGDAYQGLRASELSDETLEQADQRLMLLSGLYGLLRPLDLIQPYRLEMGTRLANPRGKNLYEFWGTRLAEALNEALADHEDQTLVHLASDEYFKAVNKKALKYPVLTCTFREERDGQLKFISFAAKRARGLMARFIIDQRLDRVEELKGFEEEGYRFREDLSSDKEFVFVRPDSR